MSTDDMFGGPSAEDVSIDTQIACILREMSYRDRVYPRWVKEGRMRQQQADHERLAMQAVLRTLNKVKKEEDLA